MEEIELNQKIAELEQRERTLAGRVVRFELAQQLAEAGCRPEAIADAAALMSTAAAIELSADGLTIGKVTLAGGEAQGVAAAARAFVKARPFLQAPADDGKPKPSPAPAQSAAALVGAAFAPAPATKPAAKPAAQLDSNASASDLVSAGWAQGAD